jgi:hypothetical protein
MRERARRRTMPAVLGSLLGLVGIAHAADPRPASPDSEFLEYLGGSDDLEAELQQYLAKPDAVEAQEANPAPKRGSGRT